MVDDESDIIEFQRRFLSRRGHQVWVATNTVDALKVIREIMPEVVLCDIRLEEDDSGLKILKEAKRLKPDMVVYLVTGLVDKALEEKALSLGAEELLIKPLSAEILEEKFKKFT